MTQHKFRALLPVKQHLYAHTEESREVMIQKKHKLAENYDHTAKQLPELQQNQTVFIQLDPGQPTWQRVMVHRTPTNRNPRAHQVQHQLQNLVCQKQNVNLPSSKTCQFRTNQTTGTSGTMHTMNGQVTVTNMTTISAHSHTQDHLTTALVMSSTMLETDRGDALAQQIY